MQLTQEQSVRLEVARVRFHEKQCEFEAATLKLLQTLSELIEEVGTDQDLTGTTFDARPGFSEFEGTTSENLKVGDDSSE
jgi:hypothetical protein